jgi:hypothetical protein
MTECEYFPSCPVFKTIHTQVIKGVFAIKYCRGSELEQCRRREIALAGKEAPLDLLPNGEHYETTKIH